MSYKGRITLTNLFLKNVYHSILTLQNIQVSTVSKCLPWKYYHYICKSLKYPSQLILRKHYHHENTFIVVFWFVFENYLSVFNVLSYSFQLGSTCCLFHAFLSLRSFKHSYSLSLPLYHFWSSPVHCHFFFFVPRPSQSPILYLQNPSFLYSMPHSGILITHSYPFNFMS